MLGDLKVHVSPSYLIMLPESIFCMFTQSIYDYRAARLGSCLFCRDYFRWWSVEWWPVSYNKGTGMPRLNYFKWLPALCALFYSLTLEYISLKEVYLAYFLLLFQHVGLNRYTLSICIFIGSHGGRQKGNARGSKFASGSSFFRENYL